jgi:hypothetical protein
VGVGVKSYSNQLPASFQEAALEVQPGGIPPENRFERIAISFRRRPRALTAARKSVLTEPSQPTRVSRKIVVRNPPIDYCRIEGLLSYPQPALEDRRSGIRRETPPIIQDVGTEHYLKDREVFTPWHLIYITCTVRVFPYVFFDLLDLDGLDFPKPI